MRLEKNQRFIGTLLSYILTILNVIVNFIYVPVLLKYLGESEYGLYQIVASFFAYITIFETSISSGVLRYYCSEKAKNNKKEMENVLAISRNIYRILAILLLGVGSILIVGYIMFYQSSFTKEQLIESIFMLIALIMNMIISMLTSVYTAAITGNERFIFSQGIKIFIQIFQPLLCCLVVMKNPYAISIVIGQLAVNTFSALVRRIYAVRKLHVKIILHEKNSKLSKEILLFAGSLLLASIADQIFWKADQIIIGKMYSTILVAVYSIGSQIYTCYQYFGTSLTVIFYSKISQLYQEKDGMNKISDLFVRTGRLVFFILYLILSGFLVFGKEFILLWVGPEYIESYYIAVFVMIPFTIDLTQNIGLSILQIMNKYSFRAKMYFVAAILNIMTTIIMTKYMGIKGAALSTGLSMFVTSGFILNWYYSSLGLQIKKFWSNIGDIFMKLLPYGTVMYIINFFVSDELSGLLGLIIKILLYSLGYFIIVYCLVSNMDERSIFRKYAIKFINKLDYKKYK